MDRNYVKKYETRLASCWKPKYRLVEEMVAGAAPAGGHNLCESYWMTGNLTFLDGDINCQCAQKLSQGGAKCIFENAFLVPLLALSYIFSWRTLSKLLQK